MPLHPSCSDNLCPKRHKCDSCDLKELLSERNADKAYIVLASASNYSYFCLDTLAAGERFIGDDLEWSANEDGDLEFEMFGETYLGSIYQSDENYYMHVSYGDFGIWYVMVDHENDIDYSGDYSDDSDFTDYNNTEFDPSNLTFVEDMPKSFMGGQAFYGLCKTDANGGQYFFEYIGFPSPATIDEFGNYAYIDLGAGQEEIAAG